jgi:cytochrome b561
MKRPRYYTGPGIINHWLTALLVTAMLALGLTAGAAPTEDMEHYVLGVHTSLGFFVFFFVLWRIGYRLYQGFPPPLADAEWERWLARATHGLILLALLLMVFTGPLYLFTEGEGVDVFGWFTVAVPLESLSVLHEPVESIHIWLGVYGLPVLLGLHIAGAIRHYLGEASSDPGNLHGTRPAPEDP